mgnify:FL=1
MRKNSCAPLTVKTKEIPLRIEQAGKLLCSVLIKQPVFEGDVRSFALRRINQYYERFSRKLLRYINTKLRKAAEEQYKYSEENMYPFNPFELRSDFTITYNKNNILSLYTEVYEFRGGAHGSTLRFADIWIVSYGSPVSPAVFFPEGTNYKKLLLDEAIQMATQRMTEGTAMYFSEYEVLMRKNFSTANIYLTESGMALFYQQYAIAPYVEGIPVFIIPYNEETGPSLPPCETDAPEQDKSNK